jgi:hypothetical protein
MDAEEIERCKRVCVILGVVRSCGVKVKYDTEQQAEKSAKRNGKKWGKEMNAYPCYWCNHWHIGRKMSKEELERYDQIYINEYGGMGDKAPLPIKGEKVGQD